MAESNSLLKSTAIKPEADELNLIHAARKDPDAFGALYRLYVEKVYRYLYSRMGNVAEAEDITAQAFLAAYESFAGFHREEHFASWLFAIARNKATDYYRQQKKLSPLGLTEDLAVENDPINEVIQSEQSLALAKLIQTLPEEERELLQLRFLAELSFPEIAHLLHRNEEAVKKSIYRLLARLHNQLEVTND